jgi:hypothetical protein
VLGEKSNTGVNLEKSKKKAKLPVFSKIKRQRGGLFHQLLPVVLDFCLKGLFYDFFPALEVV